MRRRDGQRGFLAIVAVMIIIIVAFLAVTATQQFAANSLSTQGLLRSSQSAYMGLTGLEKARNDIVYHGATCSGYDSGIVTFRPGTPGEGQYHVTGTTNVASAVLSSAVNASSTTIPISNIVGTITPSNGSVSIDNETITYTSYSNGTITGAVRGVNGTTAAAHAVGASVSQIECFLTSYSAIPALTSTTGARIFTALLIGTPNCSAFGVLNNIKSWPTVTSGGNVTISGLATIQNGEVTTSSSNYTGSNVLAAGNIWTVNGNNATTQVSDGSGGWLSQSNKANGQLNDVVMGTNLFTSATLWNHYFNASPASVQSHLAQYSSKNSVLGLQGVGIWFNGDLHLASTDVIGSATSPVLLIVNGDFQMDGQSHVYGLVYATTADMQGQSIIYGSLASPGDVSVGAGQALITQGSNVAKFACNLSTDIAFTYNPTFAFLHEVFQ